MTTGILDIMSGDKDNFFFYDIRYAQTPRYFIIWYFNSRDQCTLIQLSQFFEELHKFHKIRYPASGSICSVIFRKILSEFCDYIEINIRDNTPFNFLAVGTVRTNSLRERTVKLLNITTFIPLLSPFLSTEINFKSRFTFHLLLILRTGKRYVS